MLAVGRCSSATGRLAALGGGDEWRGAPRVALAPLATGAMIRTHFDLAPVLCLVAGLAAIARGRTRRGFALLGVGGALKLFPLAAVPVAAAWLLGQRRRGGGARAGSRSRRARGGAVAVGAGVGALAGRRAATRSSTTSSARSRSRACPRPS